VSVANCAHAGSCPALEAERGESAENQGPDTGLLSWIVVDVEHLPVAVLNEYLLYLHRLGRSPNTVRAYAHHLQSFGIRAVISGNTTNCAPRAASGFTCEAYSRMRAIVVCASGGKIFLPAWVSTKPTRTELEAWGVAYRRIAP